MPSPLWINQVSEVVHTHAQLCIRLQTPSFNII